MQIPSLIKFPYFIVSVLVFLQLDFFLYKIKCMHMHMLQCDRGSHDDLYFQRVTSNIECGSCLLFICSCMQSERHCAYTVTVRWSCYEQVAIWKLSFLYRFFLFAKFSLCSLEWHFFPLEFFFRIYLPFQFYHWNSIERKRAKNSNKIYWNGKNIRNYWERRIMGRNAAQMHTMQLNRRIIS